MTEAIEAYPLHWPLGRPRARSRQNSQFKVTLGLSIQDVRSEVARLGGDGLIISSNMPLRKDGLPFARGTVFDPGVAVYFTYKGKQVCFACDRWNTVQSNMRAIAKTIEALRGIDRWGSGDMVEQAFTGFTALPAPESWWQVLGFRGPDVTREEITHRHRRLISEHHPDNGGDTDQAARINRARDLGFNAVPS